MKVLRFHAESASHTKPHDGIMKAVEYHSPNLFRPLLNSNFEYYLKSGGFRVFEVVIEDL